MSSNLYEDISIPKQIVIDNNDNDRFSDISGIYRGVTEFISENAHQEALSGKQRVLSVIG